MAKARPAIVTILFIPAIVGLAIQLATFNSLANQLFILALFLLAPEQAYMAWVDLRRISLLTRMGLSRHLEGFTRLVWMTILGQLLGFYLAAFGFLGWGFLVVLFSLIGFNLLATIRLEPDAESPITPRDAKERRIILALNGFAACLGLFWLVNLAETVAAAGILTIVLMYVSSKWVVYGKAWRRNRSNLSAHAADATEQHPYSPKQNQ